MQEPRKFLQVLAGPRQTGKTTVVRQAMHSVGLPGHYATADEPTLQSRIWIEQQWEVGRLLAFKAKATGALLVLDEIQKVTGWSETVKRLWDADTAKNLSLKVVLLGSSPLLLHNGLTESLAGRFEIIRVTHWPYLEMRDAFGWSVEQFLYFGGYPGSAALIDDHHRWSRYIIDSLIETTISRDILLMARVDKPALLRRLFQLGCSYSGQILSYQKMLGQLLDAGNTTTLAHYLELLEGAGMLAGLQKFAPHRVQQRASSPKLQVLNTALISAQVPLSPDAALQDRDFRGRLTESAVGAHLINGIAGTGIELFYWRDRGREVDFVLRSGKTTAAIEVKSGGHRGRLPGMDAFSSAFKPQRNVLIDNEGVSIDMFLSTPVETWVS